ncbi:hypothetical protein ACFU7Y_28405, partial [Kitasatospora sp. NPDC057542]
LRCSAHRKSGSGAGLVGRTRADALKALRSEQTRPAKSRSTAETDGPGRTAKDLKAAKDLTADHDGLADLLLDAVADGASIGFLDGLDRTEAARWWLQYKDALAAGHRLSWIARDPGGGIVGTVSLVLGDKDNGRHRAKVVKLMVLWGRA